jgi:NTE family protein
MQYDLVFEGGGAKGAVFVGALQEFAARGHTARRVLGTSAGAITATVVAAGYNVQELLAVVNEKLPNGKPRFSTFMDTPTGFAQAAIESSLSYALLEKVDLPGPQGWEKKLDDLIIAQLMRLEPYREIFSFLERGGLYAGDVFLAWIREKLDAGNRKLGNATLAEFHVQTNSDLSLVASDTTGQQMLVLNHRTAPQCPVACAVRMSMSIPFIWQEVHWDAAWGPYLGNDITGYTIVDGGALSNFPIDLITSRNAYMGDTDPETALNLGLLIDETLEVEGSGEAAAPEKTIDLKGAALADVKRLRTVQRIRKLVDTLTSAHDNVAIREHAKEICRMPAKGYGTTEFDMSNERLQALVAAGRKAMKEYFDQQSF